MALTNDSELAEKIKILRSHGITREKNQMLNPNDNFWYYEQVDLGYNYRLTDIQAALGKSQLKKLDKFVDQRNQLAQKYDEHFRNLNLQIPDRQKDCYSSFHLYIVRIDFSKKKITKNDFFNSMKRKGIGVNLHYIPIHTQPYFRKLGFNEADFPEALKYYSEAVTLPLHPQLTLEQQDKVVHSLVDIAFCD